MHKALTTAGAIKIILLAIVCAFMVSACGFEPLSPADVILRYEAVNGCKLHVNSNRSDTIILSTGIGCDAGFSMITLPQTSAAQDKLLNDTLQGQSPYEDVRFKEEPPLEGICNVYGFIQVEAAWVWSFACSDESIEALRLSARNLRMAID
jgi:hypothetical protein